MFIFSLGVLFFAGPFLNTAFSASTYTIDPVHSTIGFAVKHLMVSTVRGEFKEYTGQIQFDPQNLNAFRANLVIEVQSIDTNNQKRDDHLRSSDFFDAPNHPQIIFAGKGIVSQNGGYEILGDLTIRGVTKKIRIPATIAGPVEGPAGSKVIGISAETAINRQDFGVSWNKALDQGGWVVDNDVRLIIDIEAHAE